MKRRDILKMAPAALVAGAVPAVALDQPETPVETLFREWLRLFEIEQSVYEVSPAGSDAETAAATQSLMAVERKMVAVPAQTERDWMLKAVAISCFGVFPVEDEHHPIWAEAKALVA